MHDNNDSLKKYVADSFSNFEVKPPEGMWDKISDGLAKRKRRALIVRYSSVAAVILVLLGFGVAILTDVVTLNNYTRKTAHNPQNSVNEQPNAGKPDSNSPDITLSKPKPTLSKPGVNETTPKVILSKPKKNQSESGITESVKSYQQEPEFIADQIPAVKATEATSPGNAQADNETLINPVEIIFSPIPVDELSLALIPGKQVTPDLTGNIPLPAEPDKQLNKWTLALAYGVTSGSDLTKSRTTLDPSKSRYEHDEFSAYLANETSYFEDVRNTIHEPPLSFGLMFDKKVANRISIEAGVTYTRLAFRVTTDVIGSVYSEFHNEIYYLGIPAGIKYNFIQRPRAEFYVMQWMVWEKGVTGRWNAETYKKGEIIDFQARDHEIKGIQMSSVTGIGAQYRIAGRFYIFGQGGVQLFLLNKTQPYNLRSTQPLWPSIQTGIRIGL